MPHEAEKAMHNTLNTHHTSTGTRASGVSPSEPVSQARRKPSEECTATAVTRHRRLRAGTAWDWSGLRLGDLGEELTGLTRSLPLLLRPPTPPPRLAGRQGSTRSP